MKVYLDIETTGLSKQHNNVTVVGVYNGTSVVQLVSGRDLCEDNLCELLEGISCVVTFNGKRFDVPFLEHKFPEVSFSHFEHIDLMYAGWKLGWKGGQKKIEKRLGLTRDSGIVDGREAVRLWYAHKKGDACALEQLLTYNREDIVNLQLIESAIRAEYKRQKRQNSHQG